MGILNEQREKLVKLWAPESQQKRIKLLHFGTRNVEFHSGPGRFLVVKVGSGNPKILKVAIPTVLQSYSPIAEARRHKAEFPSENPAWNSRPGQHDQRWGMHRA